ncbi:tail fiber assembly protein [Xenorhabdus sp. Vera]|uniref:tail fiber assembly protein n=1 Tax=Xenorhabdus koppenhoeferi TaxID=351659 RepID=UPI0019A245B8|nr:tail fiber assembly protein [Xenorhabdus sp. Vera]MBD2812861.1 tail fiber assembly protein [Xenorhabdus sp. Vera]
MLHLKNFKKYSPNTEEEKEIGRKFRAIFYSSENDDDWYKIISKFQENTYKVKYNSKNVICAINKDASAICPDNGSIVEVESLPDGVDILGNWQYINGKIIPREYTKNELIYQAEKQKKELLTKSNIIIYPLQDAIELDIATGQEIAALTEWKRYRVMINRVDCSFAPNIKWPKQPKIK